MSCLSHDSWDIPVPMISNKTLTYYIGTASNERLLLTISGILAIINVPLFDRFVNIYPEI